MYIVYTSFNSSAFPLIYFIIKNVQGDKSCLEGQCRKQTNLNYAGA